MITEELKKIIESAKKGQLTKQDLQKFFEWFKAYHKTEFDEAKLKEQHPDCEFEYYYVTKAQLERIVSECILFALFCKSFLDGSCSHDSPKINPSESFSETSQKFNSQPVVPETVTDLELQGGKKISDAELELEENPPLIRQPTRSSTRELVDALDMH